MQTISIKNTWVWFKDQMTHPSTLFSRTSWGVFSSYAHYRRSDHRPKQECATRETTLTVAKEMGMKYGGSYSIYKCVYCDGWHVAKDCSEEHPRKKDIHEPVYLPTSETLDVEKILATNIPENDKGRTRSERAGEKYYAGIRETPYAPFVKLCDRLANMTFSFTGGGSGNSRMREVYENEWPHFIESITVRNEDSRFSLPERMIIEIQSMLSEYEQGDNR